MVALADPAPKAWGYGLERVEQRAFGGAQLRRLGVQCAVHAR
jgi:hypothetical protein